MHHDIMRNLTRHTAGEGVMRLRCSKGIDLFTLCCALSNDLGLNITSFCGHFFVRSSDLLSLPMCDPDKAFSVAIKHDEMVLDGNVAGLQCALRDTSSSGERLIRFAPPYDASPRDRFSYRVHTLQSPVKHDLPDLYRGADAAAIISLMSNFEVDRSYSSRICSAQKSIEGSLIAGLCEYTHSTHSRLLLVQELYQSVVICEFGVDSSKAVRNVEHGSWAATVIIQTARCTSPRPPRFF